MKTTLNPFENAKRTAQGTGGSATIPPATANSIGGVKIGEGVSVTEDGTISVTPYTPPSYSTEKYDTGKKWTDGRIIYGKAFSVLALSATTTPLLVPHNENIDLVTHIYGSAKNNTTGTNFPLPFVAEGVSDNLNIRLAVTTSDISIANNTDRSMLSAIIILEFVEPIETGA